MATSFRPFARPAQSRGSGNLGRSRKPDGTPGIVLAHSACMVNPTSLLKASLLLCLVMLPACDDADGPGQCVFNGQTYPVGAQFPAGDNCNSCVCDNSPDGPQAFCGGGICDGGVPPDTAPRDSAADGSPGSDAGGQCLFNGQTYPGGAQFPAGDNCNSCSCDNSPSGYRAFCGIKICDAGVPPDSATDVAQD